MQMASRSAICIWCRDRKSTRLNSSHVSISYAAFCLKKKNTSPHTQSHTSDLNHLITSKCVENLPLHDLQTLNIINMTRAAVFVSYGASATATQNYRL